MLIPHSNYHSWQKPVLENAIDHYGKSDRKRLLKTQENAITSGLTVDFKPATKDFFTWFTPMYEASVGQKENARVHDVYEMTLGKSEQKFPYYTLGLYEQGVPVGGMIMSDRGTHYSIAYRIFLKSWQSADAPASPALYGEYQLDIISAEAQKQKLVHGQDRNPYGINSGIGLAIFKLSVGCHAVLPKTYEVADLDTEELTSDVLVLHYPGENENEITKATLITDKQSEEKYIQLKKYTDRLAVEVTYR